MYVCIYIYIYVYISKFTKKCYTQTNSSLDQIYPGPETCLALSADKQTRNYVSARREQDIMEIFNWFDFDFVCIVSLQGVVIYINLNKPNQESLRYLSRILYFLRENLCNSSRGSYFCLAISGTSRMIFSIWL